jgi:hypothetical protein
MATNSRQKDRDARWRVKHSKAKVGDDHMAFKQVDLAIAMFGY